MRRWIKCLPPKIMHEKFGMYVGVWMPQMDRYWESDDGYNVMSRQIMTDWGVVEHVTIERMGGHGDIPWAVKQEIKEALFGIRSIAIEVFPARKNLVDVMDIYHLWIMPKGFVMPFGIHPVRDVQNRPIERGYDYDLETANEWLNSPERMALIGERQNIYTLRDTAVDSAEIPADQE